MTVKQLLKRHFPELGTVREMNGSDVVNELCDLYDGPNGTRTVSAIPAAALKKRGIVKKVAVKE